MTNENKNITQLGKRVTQFEGFETFDTPEGVEEVRCISDEVTANCPVTEQPDFYTIEIAYVPNQKCVESKTLKLYFQSFRQTGHFCEKLSSIIAHDLQKALEAKSISVTVYQKSRGGISIHATTKL